MFIVEYHQLNARSNARNCCKIMMRVENSITMNNAEKMVRILRVSETNTRQLSTVHKYNDLPWLR